MNKISFLLSILVAAVFIYYITEIEKEHCNCVNDWRNIFIKSYNIGLIVLYICLIVAEPVNINFKSYILSILMIFNVVNVYAVFTLVDELEKQRCVCAVEENKHLHKVLYYYRYVMLLSIVMSFIILVNSIKTLLVIGDVYKDVKSVKFTTKGNKMVVKKSKK
jgi:hypothetical protein